MLYGPMYMQYINCSWAWKKTNIIKQKNNLKQFLKVKIEYTMFDAV